MGLGFRASGNGAGRAFQWRRRETLRPPRHGEAGHAAEHVRRGLKDRLRHGNDEAGRETLGVARLPVMVLRLPGRGGVVRAMTVMGHLRDGSMMSGTGLGRDERMQPGRHQKRQHQHDKKRPEADQSHPEEMGTGRRPCNPFRGTWFHKSCLRHENQLGFATTNG